MSAKTFVVDPVTPERFSMSFLRSAEGCLRRAHHDREVDGSSPEALVGRVFHEIAAAVGFRAVMRSEPTVFVRDAQRIAETVMRRPEDIDPLPVEVYGEVLELVGRWARKGPVFRPGEQFEISSRELIAGRIHSARIDREWVSGHVAYVRDYKTGWADPAGELTLQGKDYAWHVFRRHPEVMEVVYCEEHVRFGTPPELYTVTREDNAAFERYLVLAIERIEAAYRSGILPPNPGDACSKWGRCPVARSCPVPEWGRPSTEIEDQDHAVAAFEELMVLEARSDALKKGIRGFLEHSSQRVLQHNDQEIGWADKPGSSFQKKALAADLAITRGEPVDLKQYEKETKPGFGRRKAK